jgi:alpha-L-rhamnosidase
LEGRNRKQTAYRIIVSTDKETLQSMVGDEWDTGKVSSSQSTHIPYEGNALKSNKDYFWSVQIWDESDQTQGFGEPAHFCTALLHPSDWKSQWIGMGAETEPVFDPYSVSQDDGTGLQLQENAFEKLDPRLRDFEPDMRAPMLRTTFSLDKGVKRAKCFICGLGLFELRLNGQKVGADVLSTPRTDFRKRVYYTTYDVSDDLQVGDNAIGVLLGNGWYNAQKKYWHWQAPWFGSPRFLFQLEIEHTDGSLTRVCSDESWRGDWSPIRLNCIYDGEDYDARLEQPGWDTYSFDDLRWEPVRIVSSPGGKLVSLNHEPNQIAKRFAPVSMANPQDGVYVFDMGTIMTGWVSLHIPHGLKGETVSLRYAELLRDDGMIDTRTAGNARQADHYAMKGATDERYEPRFTYHGFRYVEVCGFPGTPEIESIEGCFVYNQTHEKGTFDCSHSLINKIHACTLQSQRCNMQMGVPTDDTQREERLGWCGDAWSYAHESFYNFDVPRFWEKWIADFYDQQNEAGLVGYITPLPGFGEDLVWSAAFVLIPWWHYIHYGDKRILQNSYPYLKKYMAYLESVGRKELPSFGHKSPAAFLFPKCSLDKRRPSKEEHGYLQHSLFGDHLATHEGGSGMGKDQPRSMATAFYHMDALVMSRIASVLGFHDDANRYTQLAVRIQQAFHSAFYGEDCGYYDVGCQSAQALALCFDLVPQELAARLRGYFCSSVNFRQRRITSGYAGTKWVIQALADAGRPDVIWSRATATDYPSWGYMLHDDKTTITENWQGEASQCHTTLGAAIDEWFYWGLAGIRPNADAPGFQQIDIKPYFPKDLHWAKAEVQTLHGVIASEWKHDEKLVSLSIRVPANCTANVMIPCEDLQAIDESGINILAHVDMSTEVRKGRCVVHIGSGNYTFAFPFPA